MARSKKKQLKSRKSGSDKNSNRAQVYKRSERIIKLLKELNYKHADIARFTGKTVSQVSHIKCGRRLFGMDDLEKIAQETDIPLFWLLLETTDEADIPEDLRSVFDAARLLFSYTRLTKRAGKEGMK